MEDFAPVLWVIVAIVAAIINIAAKAKKSAQKRGATQSPLGEDSHKEDSQSWTKRLEREWSEAMDLPRIDRNPREKDSTEEEEEEEMQEEMIAQNPSERLKTTMQTKNMDQAPASFQKNNTQTQPEETNPTTAFDLRKAVIYSEILKPKFEEES